MSLAPHSPAIQTPPAFRITGYQAPFADARPPMAGFSCTAAIYQAALITTHYLFSFAMSSSAITRRTTPSTLLPRLLGLTLLALLGLLVAVGAHA